jgi:2-dehydropantoate 2-reductase
MKSDETIYILGCGAIGLPLAVFLVNAGRKVTAVHTSVRDVPKRAITATVHHGPDHISASIETIPLSRLSRLEGIIVVTTKSYTNRAIAEELKRKEVTGPLVVLQNGLGVEKFFLETGITPIYRCILYVTSQAVGTGEFTFNPISACPIGGVLNGDESELKACIEALSTDRFPFRPEANIQREIWKKAIINSVFNSICPLLEVNNGIFAREKDMENLAHELVRECVTLTNRLGMDLSEKELMEQILRISSGSSLLISTLQDIRNGRQTEIESLNLEIARVGASLQPSLYLPKVEILGKMILAKSQLGKSETHHG